MDTETDYVEFEKQFPLVAGVVRIFQYKGGEVDVIQGGEVEHFCSMADALLRVNELLSEN